MSEPPPPSDASGKPPASVRRLRQTTPALKAIAMTGGLSQAEMEQAMETESAEFLLKPFGGAVLLETVRRVLRA